MQEYTICGPAEVGGMTTSECPCGRARAGCEYHDPALQPARAPADIMAEAVRAVEEMTRSYGIGNAPRPEVGAYIRVPVGGKICRARVVAVRAGRVDVVLDGVVRVLSTTFRVRL